VAAIEIICLANSYKLRGRCVAGLRADGKGWIRPVSELAGGTLGATHYTCEGGSAVRPMDLVEIDIAGGQPLKHQRENVLLTPSRWRLLERPAPIEYADIIGPASVSAGPLLGGTGDRRNLADFPQGAYASSLALVAPTDTEWEKTTTSSNNPQLRCHFQVGKNKYNLAVTDPAWIPRFAQFDHGIHRADEIGVDADQRLLLCVSMGEPIPATGDCYRLVAAVIPLSPEWQEALFE